ncbi:MAG: outer membrane lipoprotein chaperone LolA [Betaproteobacteria bacterium]|nr:outer membrane lipoprotein chaperone LolA [Betaproteobacteria bacterium]
MAKIVLILLAAWLSAADAVAAPSAPAVLREFIGATHAARARFTQTVVDQNGRVIQTTNGTMAFSRPGRFRWVYEAPYRQVIVGDSKTLWLYDPDLNQVTEEPLGQAIGESPAALLAGSDDIEKLFLVRTVPGPGGLYWIEAAPKSRESTFAAVRMGFAPGGAQGPGLREMILKDNFGHTTYLRFSDFVRNPAFPPGLFHFVPPKGADVLGAPGVAPQSRGAP